EPTSLSSISSRQGSRLSQCDCQVSGGGHRPIRDGKRGKAGAVAGYRITAGFLDFLEKDMRLKETLEAAIARAPAGQDVAEAFLEVHSDKPRYAIGKNSETLAIHGVCPLDGVIDDYAAPSSAWQGIPLLHARDASRSARVVNCS